MKNTVLLNLVGLPRTFKKTAKYLFKNLINIEHIYENCALMDEIDEYLAKFNFKRVKTHITDCKSGDALYVKINTLSN